MIIQDTTLRDGMQQRKIKKSHETRKKVLKQILKSNIDSIEIGMCSNFLDFNFLKEILGEIPPNVTPVILTRLHEKDIALTSKLEEFHEKLTMKLLFPVSLLHIKEKLHLNYETAILFFEKHLELATTLNKRIDVCLEDATRADVTFLTSVLDVCNRYEVGYVTLPDTLGFSTPKDYGELFQFLNSKKYHFKLSAHCHNDLGLATANTIAAIENGASQFEGTFLGIGERAGNTSIEEVCVILNKKLNIPTPLVLKNLTPICRAIEDMLEFKRDPLKPIFGDNIYVHESGIHQDGMLKNRNMYQFIMPEEIGGAKEVMPISGISSRKVIEKYLDENGIDYSNSTEIIEFYRSVSKLVDDLSLREITLLFEFLQGSILGVREGENHELTV